jgi:hypothetical protein
MVVETTNSSIYALLDNMPHAEGDIKGVADITSQLIGMELPKHLKVL